MRKLTALVLALLLVTGALGVASAQAEEGVTLVFWDMPWGAADTYGPAMRELLDRACAEIEGLDKVEYVNMTWDSFMQTFQAAIYSNTEPDLFTCGYGHAELFAKQGVVEYLDDIYADESLSSQYSDTIWSSRMYDGHMVQVPLMTSETTFFYRTDMFEKVGYAQSPTTWAEFLDALRAIKAEYGITPFTFDAGGGQSNHFVLTSLFNNGVGCVKQLEDGSVVPNMDSPEAKHMYEIWITMLKEGLVAPSVVSNTRADNERIYLNGECAVFLSDMAITTANSELGKVTAAMNVLLGPDATQPRALTYINGVGIFKRCEHTDIAKQLVRYLAAHSYDAFMATGIWEAWPARAADFDTYIASGVNFVTTIAKNIPYMTPAVYPMPSCFEGWGTIDGESSLGKVAQMVFSGSSDNVDDIAAYANQIVQDALDAAKVS